LSRQILTGKEGGGEGGSHLHYFQTDFSDGVEQSKRQAAKIDNFD